MEENYNFFLIALKVGQNCSHGRRILRQTEPYYFCQGYRIIEDGSIILVDEDKCINERVFNDYLREKAGEHNYVPIVNIHAIVGKNGSGKSSLVEMMIRLLNNFSAILFGETITSSNTEHLHYIDGIEGELYYMQGENPYRLSIYGQNVKLDKYRINNDANSQDRLSYRIVEDKHLVDISVDDCKTILEVFNDGIEYYIDTFFYTIVSNYSIYAYNPLDYLDEKVNLNYEKVFLRQKSSSETKKKVKISSWNWLNGLFHKNDGYKTPLVLTPFRDEGTINISVENTLSRERFISLLLMSDTSDGNGFHIINGHLKVEGFSFIRKSNYGRSYINKNVEISKLSLHKYKELMISIIDSWNEKLFGNDSPKSLKKMARSKLFGEIALNYLIYKTIKICTKYQNYKHYFDSLESYLNGDDNDLDFFTMLDSYIDDLIENRSHITRKIRQTLAYLITPDNLDVYKSRKGFISINKMAKGAQEMATYIKQKYENEFFVRDIEDMIPPPFMKVKILLKDTTTDKPREKIAFETLSSGEKQQVYSISSMLYHLININSVEEDKSSNRYSYHYVNIVLEEIELYFHPDFQKRYISMILDGLAQVRLENIYGINICFITHSPFVLSDIPRGNILALEDGESAGENKLKTFGANIYDMLKSSFFIEDSPIGCYAQWIITRVIIAMRMWRCLLEHDDVDWEVLMNMVSSPKIGKKKLDFLNIYADKSGVNASDNRFFKVYSKEYLLKTICQIDEPLIRNSLMAEWDELFSRMSPKEKEIARLERRLAELQES